MAKTLDDLVAAWHKANTTGKRNTDRKTLKTAAETANPSLAGKLGACLFTYLRTLLGP